MKILFLTLGYPSSSGGGAQVRDYHLFSRIAQTDRVWVVALMDDAVARSLESHHEPWCQAIYTVPIATSLRSRLASRLPRHFGAGRPLATLPFIDRRSQAQCLDVISSCQPDLVQIEHSFLAPYLDVSRPHCATVLSLHNVGTMQYRRMARLAPFGPRRLGAQIKSRLMRGWEIREARRFDEVVVVSETDAKYLRRHGLGSHVVHNGVDTMACKQIAPARNSTNLLFVGNLSYEPNVDGVEWFCESVLPRIQAMVPSTTLTVIGHSPPGRIRELAGRGGITVVGSVGDVEPFYRSSAIAIVPLRAGSGTRIKILEAMSFGRTVVSTSIGSEGLSVVDGHHLLLADEATEFAARIVRLLRSPGERQRIVRAARRLVEQKYEWNRSAETLRTVLKIAYERSISPRSSVGVQDLDKCSGRWNG